MTYSNEEAMACYMSDWPEASYSLPHFRHHPHPPSDPKAHSVDSPGASKIATSAASAVMTPLKIEADYYYDFAASCIAMLRRFGGMARWPVLGVVAPALKVIRDCYCPFSFDIFRHFCV